MVARCFGVKWGVIYEGDAKRDKSDDDDTFRWEIRCTLV